MLGWPPSEFWAASLFELTAALAVEIERNTPMPKPPMSDDELFSMLAAVPAIPQKKG